MDPIKKMASFPQGQGVATLTKGNPLPKVKEDKEREYDYQEKMSQVHNMIEESLGITNFKLNFSVDKETRTVVVKVINSETGEVIREIPPEEILAIAREMERLKGILFNSNI